MMSKCIVILFGLVMISSIKDSLAAGNPNVPAEMVAVPDTGLAIPNPNPEIQELFQNLDGIIKGHALTWYINFLSQGYNIWQSANTAAAAYLGLVQASNFFEKKKSARKQIMSLINNYLTHFRELNLADPHIPGFQSLSTLNNAIAAKDQEMTNLAIERRRNRREAGPSGPVEDDEED